MADITQKFRLTLTLEEIQDIVTCMNLDTSGMTTRTKNKLILYIQKAKLGIVAAGYTSTTRQTTLEKLDETILTPEQKRSNAYMRYKQAEGDTAALSPSTIQLALTYMYENDLMTSEEENEFLGGE